MFSVIYNYFGINLAYQTRYKKWQIINTKSLNVQATRTLHTVTSIRVICS